MGRGAEHPYDGAVLHRGRLDRDPSLAGRLPDPGGPTSGLPGRGRALAGHRRPVARRIADRAERRPTSKSGLTTPTARTVPRSPSSCPSPAPGSGRASETMETSKRSGLNGTKLTPRGSVRRGILDRRTLPSVGFDPLSLRNSVSSDRARKTAPWPSLIKLCKLLSQG